MSDYYKKRMEELGLGNTGSSNSGKNTLAKSDNKATSNNSSGDYFANRMKALGLNKSNVDDTYISNFLRDAQSYLSSAKTDYQSITSENKDTIYSSRKNISNDLRTRSSNIRQYLENNKDAVGSDSYNSLKSQLDDFDKKNASIAYAFYKAQQFYSKFADENAYNAWQQDNANTLKYGTMTAEELKEAQNSQTNARKEERDGRKKDGVIVQDLLLSNIPYSRQHAEQDGWDMSIYDEVEQKRNYISQKYGVKFTESYYENSNLLLNLIKDLENGTGEELDNTVAYTLSDGTKVTWDNLYDNAYRQKYQGKTYDQLNEIISSLEDGEEKSWLTAYAPSVMTAEDYDKEIAATDTEIQRLQEMNDRIYNSDDVSGYALETWYTDYSTSAPETRTDPETDAKNLALYNELRGDFESFGAIEQKIAKLKRQKQQLEDGRKYNLLQQNADFAEKSRYVSTGGTDWLALTLSQYNIGDTDDVYEYINNQDGVRDRIGHKHNYKKYDYLLDTEIAKYNYLYKTEGEKSANEYLKYLEENLNARWASKKAEELHNTDNVFEKNVVMGVLPFIAGAESWLTGTAQNLTDKELPTSVTQYLSSEVLGSLDGFAKYMYLAANTVGNMLPSILISKGLGTSGLVTDGVAKSVGSFAVGASAGGNAYGQALKEGYGEEQARTYGFFVGASEALLERLIGGISDLGGIGTEKILAKVAAIDDSFLRITAKLGVNVASETTEEELQNFLEPTFRAIIFGEEYDAPEIDELIETAIVTAISTGTLEGPNTIVEDIIERPIYSEGSTDALQQLAMEMEDGAGKQHISMVDFANRESSVWRNVDYADNDTKISIMQETHNAMLAEGAVVKVSDEIASTVDQAYPDLRDMKKKDRTPILKSAMSKLKNDIRQFLNGFKNQTFAFDVNGKVLDATLYNTGINEVLEKVSKEKANMLYSTEDIFRNARYLYSTQDYDSDPNVYRWNYFYTPVQIGEDTVGVRIAVRDMVQGQEHRPESQIYNWGIKKDASLGGVQPVVSNSSHGASSDASTNNISQTMPGVNDEFSSLQGKTILMSENREVSVKKFTGFTDGNATVKLDDGTEVAEKDISFSNEDENTLFHFTAREDGMTPSAANAIWNLWRANKQSTAPIPAKTFRESAFAVWRAGVRGDETILNGKDNRASALTAQQKEIIYEAGRKAAQDSTDAAQKNIDAVYEQAKAVLQQKGKTSSKTYRAVTAKGVYVKDMSPTQRASFLLAQKIAPAVKADIEVYNGGKEWGYYNPRTDKICLNINAKWNGQTMLAFTLAHELLHRTKRGSPAQYKAFADFLVKKFGEQGSDITAMVAQQMEAADAFDKTVPENQRIHMTEDMAFEEVVADACQRMLLDTDAGKRLAEFGAQSEQNRSFLKRFAKWLRELLENLRNVFQDVTPDSLAAKEFAKFEESVKQTLADMFVKMNIDAGEKLSTIKEAGLTEKITTVSGGVKYSLNKNAKSELHKALYDTKYRNDVLLRDETPVIMLAQKGVRNLPMAMKASHIRENVFSNEEAARLGLPTSKDINYHGLGEELFLKIIDGLDNVKEAYRGTKNADNPMRGENYFLLISEFTDSEGNIVNVPVFIDEHGQCNRVFIETNKISTVFGRRNFREYIARQVKNGNLVRIKNKSNLASERSAPIAEGYGKIASTDSIRNSEQNVNENFEELVGSPKKLPVSKDISDWEMPSTIEGTGLTEKITTDDGGVKRKQQVSASESKRPYSYSSFIKKPDMKIVRIDGTVPESRADIIVQAKKNAASVGKVDPKTGNISVYIKDIGVDVFLGRDGLRHSIDRRLSVNAPVVLKAGDILENSIQVNEITPKKEKATGSYVLIGAARNSGGELFIVRSVVNRFTHNLTSMDVLYAINAKKEPAALLPLSTDKTALGTDSTISIARLLDYVNEYFPDILPKEVFKHYGHTERPKGDLGDSALYKLPVSKDITDRAMLVDMFEQMVTDSTEYKVLQKYKSHMDEMLALEEKVERLTAEIGRLSFAEGPRDTEYLNKLKLQKKQAINRLNYYDNKLLGLEKSGVLKAMIERNRQKVTQESFDRAKAYYKERNERREADIRQYYRESRRKAVERHDMAEVRQQIRKDVQRLDSLLNKGTKNKNVKLGLQEFVGSALRLAKGTFLTDYNEYDMIRAGLQNTLLPEEQAAFNRCRELLQELDNLPEEPGPDSIHDKWDPEQAIRREDREAALKKELAQNMRILRDGNVFQRERAGTEQATAEELLGELMRAYKALENSEMEHIRGVYNEELYKQIDKVRNFLAGKAIKDMTAVELKELQKMYRMVSHTVSKANELFGNRWKQNVQQRGEKAYGQLQSPVSKDMPAFLEKVASLGWSIFSLDTAMEIIGSDVLIEHVQELYDSEDTYQRDLEHARKFAEEQAKKYNRKNWKLDKKVSFAGTEITLSQAMSLYAYSRRKQGQGHLEGDGFVHSKNVRIKKNLFGKLPVQLGYVKNATQSYKVTREMYGELEKLLTSEQREYVKAMQEYLSKVMGAKGNEVSVELHGIPLFEETIYFPLKTAKVFSDTALGATTGERKLKNTGFTEAAKKGADNAIVLDDFERVWSEHVNEMSNYHAYVLAIENFNRVYNYHHMVEQAVADAEGEVYKTELVDTNESVKLAIENRAGSAANAYIVKYMQNLNGGVRSDATEALANGLLGNFRKTRVLGSGSVIVQQPSAFLRAMAKLDMKDLVGWKQWRQKYKKPPEGLMKEMYRYCPVAGLKKMGGFDPSVGRTARQYLFSEYHDGENPLQRTTGWVNEKLGMLPEAMDEITWTYIWYCSKQQTLRKHPELRAGSKEFCEEAAKLFSQIIRETQVYDSIMVKPKILQSKNTWVKSLTSFMNEPLKGLNQVIRAWVRVKHGKTKARQAVRETAAVYAAELVAGALSAFFYAFRDDDDDETYWEKYLSALTGKAWEGLFPLYKLPYIKDVISLIEGYRAERSDTALVKEFLTGVENIFKPSTATTPAEKEKEVWDRLEKGYGYLLNFIGIPGSNLIREIRGIYRTAKKTWEKSWVKSTNTGTKYALIEGLPFTREFSKQKQLENAVVEEDTEHLVRVVGTWDNQDTALSNLRTAIRDVWLVEKITDDKAREYLEDFAGVDSAKTQDYITKWEFRKTHPEVKLTDAQILDWDEYAEPSGISLETYTQYVKKIEGLTSEKDKDGDPIPGSKQKKVVNVIHALPLTRRQKDALYLAEEYAENGLKDTPWH